MKITYADIRIEIQAEEDLMNGPLEIQLSDDVQLFVEGLEEWLNTLALDEYPNFEFKVSTC